MTSNKYDVQVASESYNFSNYVNLARWNSYWHQIHEAASNKPNEVLIIGIGDNIVEQVLSNMGIHVYTFDFDANLHPDFEGDIQNILQILNGKKFDVVLCCQVLEHLPFELFDTTLQQLRQVAKQTLILSLPYSGFTYSIAIKLPLLKKRKITIRFSKEYKQYSFDGQHYWEVGKKGYSQKRIKRSISEHFNIAHCFFAPHNDYHLFYILQPKLNNHD